MNISPPLIDVLRLSVPTNTHYITIAQWFHGQNRHCSTFLSNLMSCKILPNQNQASCIKHTCIITMHSHWHCFLSLDVKKSAASATLGQTCMKLVNSTTCITSCVCLGMCCMLNFYLRVIPCQFIRYFWNLQPDILDLANIWDSSGEWWEMKVCKIWSQDLKWSLSYGSSRIVGLDESSLAATIKWWVFISFSRWNKDKDTWPW